MKDGVFETTDELMAYLREHAEDLDRVSVHVTPGLKLEGPEGQRVQMTGVSGLLHNCDGNRLMIHRDDLQLLLNEGILSRLKIPIVLEPSP